MYSYDQRIRAIELLVQYDMSYSTVIRVLGYPTCVHSLRNWYKESKKKGGLKKEYTRKHKFTERQKKTAVKYYLEHGKCISKTCKKLGYPSRSQLKLWINEIAPSPKKPCRSSTSSIKYPREHKEQAVIESCLGTATTEEVVAKYGTTRRSLYNWRRQLLKREAVLDAKKDSIKRMS